MTPRSFDAGAVQAKLAHLEELLSQLERRRGSTSEQFEEDDTIRSATLWVLTQLVTVAAGVNAHLAVARSGRTPASYRESFELAADAGAFPRGLLPALRKACGMRNVLTHEYGEIDLDVVAASIGPAIEVFSDYARAVAAFILDLEG